ncbi:hypothetical protein QNI16_20545 [Cytophagaceae bacterium YF14B1]|uniref:Acyl carrier protein n=1 Tax=Xanthocytophaga flava TaxID=3048013 RepID=A0AAE3QUQ4_9BACT|nr:hypothetical protein [Xanthocytophaga flavus]MDJ1482903.1 hypothetical protein [Xanthocytophaga flavus]
MDTIRLENTDPDDIMDILCCLEKSFGIRFGENDFMHVDTFGDLCDVIEKSILFEDRNDCTTQQAFYKVRNALRQTIPDCVTVISPDTQLHDLFPRYNRHRMIRRFEKNLGVKVGVLSMQGWLSIIITSGFLASFVCLFLYLKVAVIGFLLSYLVAKLANRTAKELNVKTVGQLTKKLTREHYLFVRRSAGTVNRNEIFAVIQDVFSDYLSLDKQYLTRDASLGWG